MSNTAEFSAAGMSFRKGTSDLLLKLGAKPLAESGVKIYELFYNTQP